MMLRKKRLESGNYEDVEVLFPLFLPRVDCNKDGNRRVLTCFDQFLCWPNALEAPSPDGPTLDAENRSGSQHLQAFEPLGNMCSCGSF